MEILFTITSIIYLSYFVLFIYGFYNPQKSLFWLKINKEKTKNLSHYLNGSLFLVFFIISLIIFEFSGIRAEKEKLDAQLQVQTALEKQKQDEKNKKVEEKEPEKNNSEKIKEIETIQEDKDTEGYKKVGIKFGLTENIRKDIFAKSVLIERRAMKEIEDIYYNSGQIKQMNGTPQEKSQIIAKHKGDLETKYKTELCKKHNINEDQLRHIHGESVYKEWELPAQ